MPLAEDEEGLKGAVPLFFGDSFKRKMKDHLESLKYLHRSIAPKSGVDQFLFGGATLTILHVGAPVSEEEAGVRNSTHTSKEEETDPCRRRTMLPKSNKI